MDNVAERINKAFIALSRIYVSGDAVALMAEVRKELRAAYQLAKECQTEEPKEAEERCTKSYT